MKSVILQQFDSRVRTICWHAVLLKRSILSKLENVSIAKALQLEAARRRALPIRFNFVARAKFELAQPIRCRVRAFSLLIRYVTL